MCPLVPDKLMSILTHVLSYMLIHIFRCMLAETDKNTAHFSRRGKEKKKKNNIAGSYHQPEIHINLVSCVSGSVE